MPDAITVAISLLNTVLESQSQGLPDSEIHELISGVIQESIVDEIADNVETRQDDFLASNPDLAESKDLRGLLERNLVAIRSFGIPE